MKINHGFIKKKNIIIKTLVNFHKGFNCFYTNNIIINTVQYITTQMREMPHMSVSPKGEPLSS